MTLVDDFRRAMVVVGEKIVAPNDVEKDAYYVNVAQRRVMQAAGHQPLRHDSGVVVDIRIAGTGERLPTNYYESQRSGRTEVRMGPALARWLNVGDTLLLGTDGRSVFALKTSPARRPSAANETDPDESESESERLGRQLSKARLIDAVNAVGGPVGQKSRESSVYERDPLIRAFARERSRGICEMPGCGWRGFEKADGSIYIEVHHIIFFGEGGEDVISNVAAVCPNCHKRAHFSRERESIQTTLLDTVRIANQRFV